PAPALVLQRADDSGFLNDRSQSTQAAVVHDSSRNTGAAAPNERSLEMPQPDSSRSRAQDIRYSNPGRPWPVDPAAPQRHGAGRGPGPQRPQDPEKDGRTPDDKDGNE